MYKLKIFMKKKSKPFCEIEIDDIKTFDALYKEISSEKEYIKFGQVIFKRYDVDYAVIEEMKQQGEKSVWKKLKKKQSGATVD